MEIKEYLENLPLEEREFFDEYFKERNSDLGELVIQDNVIGELNSTCRPPGQRPLFHDWIEFKDIITIKSGNDWTIFGKAKHRRSGSFEPIVIDLLESSDKLQIKIDTYYPWVAKLSDSNAVSYRISGNKLIIRCLKIPSSRVSYCYLTGMIAVEASGLKSPCDC